MPLKIKVAPAAYPLEVSDLAEHAILNEEDASYAQTLIRAATGYLDGDDGILGRALVTQQWYYYRDRWPCGDCFTIPLPPLVSVASIKYTDCAGVEAAWGTSNYIVDISSEPGRIVLAYNQCWPSVVLAPVNAIKVEFTAGYGATPESVPEPIRQAMRMHCATLYQHRDAVLVGSTTTLAAVVPMGFDALIAPYRLHFWEA